MALQAVENIQTACDNHGRTCAGKTFVPPVNVREYDDRFTVTIDVPGATADGIDVNYERGLLTVRARVTPRQTNGAARWFLREYGVGDFSRSFRIGEGIDADRLDATVANGVLTLTLPKAEAAKPRKIEVKAAG